MKLAGPTSNSFISQRLRLHYAEWGDPEAPVLILQHGGRAGFGGCLAIIGRRSPDHQAAKDLGHVQATSRRRLAYSGSCPS